MAKMALFIGRPDVEVSDELIELFARIRAAFHRSQELTKHLTAFERAKIRQEIESESKLSDEMIARIECVCPGSIEAGDHLFDLIVEAVKQLPPPPQHGGG